MKSNKLQVCKILKHFAPNLVDGLSEEDILKICGILDSNSFRIDKHGSRGKIIPPFRKIKVQKFSSINSPLKLIQICFHRLFDFLFANVLGAQNNKRTRKNGLRN